jgi:hypothetical protein
MSAKCKRRTTLIDRSAFGTKKAIRLMIDDYRSSGNDNSPVIRQIRDCIDIWITCTAPRVVDMKNLRNEMMGRFVHYGKTTHTCCGEIVRNCVIVYIVL